MAAQVVELLGAVALIAGVVGVALAFWPAAAVIVGGALVLVAGLMDS